MKQYEMQLNVIRILEEVNRRKKDNTRNIMLSIDDNDDNTIKMM